MRAATIVVAAGVEQYEDPGIAPLTYAVADARAVAAAFRASGVPATQVTVLTSDQTQPALKPTRGRLIRALEHARRTATPDDKLVFFFAGHGVDQDGEQYLLCQDTSQDLLPDTALPMTLVGRALSGLQAAEVLFLIDACRNDPRAGRGGADAVLSEAFARGLRPMLAAREEAPRPRLMATLLACDIGQRAWEDPDERHGVFTTYLLRGLAGEAAAPDGQVKLSGMADYVTRQVRLWSARTRREQRPRLLNPDGGDMTILTPPPEPVVSVAFQNHTLAQAVDLIAEQYGAQVVLGKGVDPEAKVTGRLDNQALSATLRVLLLAHELVVRREGKIYIVERSEPTSPPVALAEAQALLGDWATQYPGPVLAVAPDGAAPYRSVQQAVDAAADGAIVALAPGTYQEQVTVNRNIAIVGVDGWQQTILSGAGPATVRIEPGVANALLMALTVYGEATPDAPHDTVWFGGQGTILGCDLQTGGESASTADGWDMLAHSLRVAANPARPEGVVRVIESRLSGVGAAIDGAARLESVSITNAGHNGVMASPGAYVELVDCLVQDSVMSGVVMRQASAVLERTVVEYSGEYGLLVIDRSAADAKGCRFSENVLNGVLVSEQSAAAVTDCAITANQDHAIRSEAGAVLTAENCDLRFNRPGALIREDDARSSLTSNLYQPGDPAARLDGRRRIAEPEVGPGEKLLFNGRDLGGWRAVDANGKPFQGAFRVEDGVLVADGPSGTYLLDQTVHSDFHISFDYRLGPGCNNGLVFWVGDLPSQQRLEVQIADRLDGDLHNQHGSLFNLAARANDPGIPPGVWSSMTVLAQGSRLRVTIDGQTVLETDLRACVGRDPLQRAALARPRGRIGFSTWSGRTEFRNIKLLPLPQ